VEDGGWRIVTCSLSSIFNPQSSILDLLLFVLFVSSWFHFLEC